MFYELIIEFISSEEETGCYNDIFLKDLISEEKENFGLFLKLISKISENHHRSANFIIKIEQILSHYSSEIKQTFTNLEIFEIFQNDKLILLFLFEQKIIIADKSILYLIIKKSAKSKAIKDEQKSEERRNRCFNYDIYFYPETKSIMSEKQRELIESKLSKQGLNEGETFNQKRKKGENDSYLCEMIRQDSVEAFIAYVTQTCLSLQKTIETSIFETNQFLIMNDTTLIEYAAFFGSIQILQYLSMNGVKLQSSLWKYAIHGNNPSIIHLLEENHVNPPYQRYRTCLKESIKCHHNGIARYIIDNLMSNEELLYDIGNDFNDNLYSYSFEYMNYHFFPENHESEFIFHYLCQFGYSELVQLYLQEGNIDINQVIISI